MWWYWCWHAFDITADVLLPPLPQFYGATATEATGMLLLIPLVCYSRLCCNTTIPPPPLMLLAKYHQMLPLLMLLSSTTTCTSTVAIKYYHQQCRCCDQELPWQSMLKMLQCYQYNSGRGMWDMCVGYVIYDSLLASWVECLFWVMLWLRGCGVQYVRRRMVRCISSLQDCLLVRSRSVI